LRNSHRFGSLEFNSSFSLAHDGTGREIRFTRSERELLRILAHHPRRLFSRAQLIEKVSPGSESDRYIDYLVARLRTKLGDNPRNPAFIATHHGEGYLWIAAPKDGESDGQRLDALLVIGPVFGLRRNAGAERGRAVLERLCTAVGDATIGDERIVIRENWTFQRHEASGARFTMDVSFFSTGGVLHCAAALRNAVTRRVLETYRFVADDPPAPGIIDDIAASIRNAMWMNAATPDNRPGPRDVPLELQMHNAAKLLTDQAVTYATAGEELAERRRKTPDDPEVNLMWAMHLYMRILQNPADFDKRAAYETEIGAIVHAHLPSYRDNPIHRLAAARLLMLAHPGDLDTAELLAEEALAETPAFAASFAMLGKVKMCRGDLDEAIGLYDSGIELAEPASEFHVFLLVQKCLALSAAGDREALDACCAALYAARPAVRPKFGYFFAAEDALPPDLELALGYLTAEQCRYAVGFLHYFSARSFHVKRHRENVMRGMIAHAVRKFGPAVVPDEVWQSVPRLRRRMSASMSG